MYKYKVGSWIEVEMGHQWIEAKIISQTTADFDPIYCVEISGTKEVVWAREPRLRSIPVTPN